MARCWFGVPLIVFLISAASAQHPPHSDPQAVSFASQSMVAPKNCATDAGWFVPAFGPLAADPNVVLLHRLAAMCRRLAERTNRTE
jgi:hypothetical protein